MRFWFVGRKIVMGRDEIKGKELVKVESKETNSMMIRLHILDLVRSLFRTQMGFF